MLALQPNSAIVYLSYSVLSGSAAASWILASAAAYCLFFSASCAGTKSFATFSLLVFLPAARAGAPVVKTAAPRRMADATVTVTFMFPVYLASTERELNELLTELRHVGEADLLHVVALGRCQHLCHDTV